MLWCTSSTNNSDSNTGVWRAGEERVEVNSALVHAAIVTEGVSLTSDDLLAVGLVAKVLGCQPGLEYSSTNSATKLYKAVSSAVPDQNFAVCTN